jgi:hypothetical protein
MNTGARIVAATVFIGILAGCGLALLHNGLYGWTIFALLPGFLGGAVSWSLRPATGGENSIVGAVSAVFGAFFLLAIWQEGLICVLMALPLVVPMGALGGWLAYRFEAASRLQTNGAAMLLLVPVSLFWDTTARPAVFEVKTAIEIAASPEQVWNRVVAFPALPEPHEWYFRAGLAYPQRARIEGTGVGAVRYCEFSTGPFVEPIEVWDQPHLLRFRVTDNPPPLREWSPFGELNPKHLHGYLISKQGQFRLTRLANNHTLLEGTTWYQHGLWPAQYWRCWSDAIIHRIHLRVLNHIRELAEHAA